MDLLQWILPQEGWKIFWKWREDSQLSGHNAGVVTEAYRLQCGILQENSSSLQRSWSSGSHWWLRTLYHQSFNSLIYFLPPTHAEEHVIWSWKRNVPRVAWEHSASGRTHQNSCFYQAQSELKTLHQGLLSVPHALLRVRTFLLKTVSHQQTPL